MHTSIELFFQFCYSIIQLSFLFTSIVDLLLDVWLVLVACCFLVGIELVESLSDCCERSLEALEDLSALSDLSQRPSCLQCKTL